jgi:hypothetical protein
MSLPDYITKYLWDVNADNISPTTHGEFIIERILEYGDTDSLKWIEKTYEKSKIIEVLKKSKKISPKTGNFYALYFNISKEELLCIRKPFTQKQNRF